MSKRFSEFLPETTLDAKDAPVVDVADLIEESIAVFGLDIIVTAWNAEAERLYGWKREEVIGGKVQAAVKCSPSQPLKMILEQVQRTGEWRGEFVRTTKSGRAVRVKAKWSLRRNANGDPVDIVETSRDVTDLWEAKAAQEWSERRYRDFFNFVPVGLWLLDGSELIKIFEETRAAGVVDFFAYLEQRPELAARTMDALKIIKVNERALKMLHATSAELLNRSVARYWTESPEVFCRAVAARYAGEREFEAQIKLPTHDGAVVDALFFAGFTPITGAAATSMIAMIDISDHVATQNMLAKIQAEFAHASRVTVLGELTASIAHEVSQPLTAISTNIEAGQLWLTHTPPNIEEVRQILKRTAGAAQRAADIIHRIRSMVTHSAPEHTPIELNPIVQEAILFLHHEFQRYHVKSSLQLADSLPITVGDRVQLQQVIVNLAVNAIQAMEQANSKQRQLQVNTTATPDGRILILLKTAAQAYRR